MHQIDLGVIIRLIMAILKNIGSVLKFLPEESDGLAAKKLQARLRKVLERRSGPDGRKEEQ
jgi:hypothetical protein